MGDRLAKVVRDGDTVARFGGDEFAALLESAVDRRDAMNVAIDYDTHFPTTCVDLSPTTVEAANRVLAAHLDVDDFARVATEVGQSLWQNKLVDVGDHSVSGAIQAIKQGNATRQALGHYQGAMFYFDGEWFWGVDRIRLLEKRLIAEGYDRYSEPISVPEPAPRDLNKSTDGILLEYFPSLRSPYTAIGHQRVLDLISRTGVAVRVRPVIPMMMRGIPAPRAKQRYIITDAAREGREHGTPLARIVDPFGEPVKRAFSLFPAAQALGRAMEYVTAYLHAAWVEGIDISHERGLKQGASNAGLEWQDLIRHSKSVDWEAILVDNLATLTGENLWGVPSFRVSGGNATQSYACWGQDRIWRVAKEISRRA